MPDSAATPLILVVGMHRSGTSLLASILQAIGVSLPGPLIEADVHNPYGYFEHRKIVEFQEKLLIDLGRWWPPAKMACCHFQMAGSRDLVPRAFLATFPSFSLIFVIKIFHVWLRIREHLCCCQPGDSLPIKSTGRSCWFGESGTPLKSFCHYVDAISFLPV